MAGVKKMKEVVDLENEAAGITEPEPEIEAQYGIEETADVLDFIGVLIDKGAQFKQFSIGMLVSGVTQVAPAALRAVSGIGDVPKEIANLDPQEKTDLVTRFARNFKLDNAAAEALVEQGVLIVAEIAVMYKMFVDYKQGKSGTK